MNRFWYAMAAYAVLALLVWLTIDDRRFQLVTWLILAMLAIKTLIWEKRLEQERAREGDSE